MPDSQQPTFNTDKIRKCSYLLPTPGGDVVRDLLDEIERLQEKLRQLHRKIVTTTCPTCSGYQWAMPEGATICRCEFSSEAAEAGGDDE